MPYTQSKIKQSKTRDKLKPPRTFPPTTSYLPQWSYNVQCLEKYTTSWFSFRTTNAFLPASNGLPPCPAMHRTLYKYSVRSPKPAGSSFGWVARLQQGNCGHSSLPSWNGAAKAMRRGNYRKQEGEGWLMGALHRWVSTNHFRSNDGASLESGH